MAKKIEVKTEPKEVKELKKGVQCANCRNSNHTIKDRQIYCNKKRKNMSAFALDCADFE